MNKLKFIAIFLFAALIFTACASDSGEYSTRSQPNKEPAPSQVQDSKADADEGGGGGGGGKKEATANPQVSLDDADKSKEQPAKVTERKIIRNANLKLESASPEKVQKTIATIAEDKKGFVVQSTQSSSKATTRGRDRVSMTIRIPAEKFTESIDEIRKAADRVIVESVTGRDVTEEFIDIEARLKTKKALEEKFLEIMKQSKSVQDALNVQRELAKVRGEIERIEGRKRFLENQSSLSTIKIEIQTPTAISGSPTGFFYELKEAVGSGFDAALTFILFLVQALIALLPFLLLVVLPVFLLLRYFWRKYKKKRIARKIIEEEEKIIDVE